MARKIYGIYKDDLPACIGTEDECAAFLETTINGFRSMLSKQKKRNTKAFKRRIYNRKNM